MKSYFILSVLLVLGVFVQAQNLKMIYDKYAAERKVGSFHSIRVSHAFQVIMQQSDQPGLAISASDEKTRDRIQTIVRDGVLIISYDGTGFLNKNTQLRAYISFKELRTLEISGASNIKIDGSWKGGDAKILLSGASDIKGDLALDYLQFKQSGASNAKLSGRVDSLDLWVSGASDFKGYDLIINGCNTEVSGASDVELTTNKNLKVNATGASDVRFKGDVRFVYIRNSGASSVKRVER